MCLPPLREELREQGLWKYTHSLTDLDHLDEINAALPTLELRYESLGATQSRRQLHLSKTGVLTRFTQ